MTSPSPDLADRSALRRELIATRRAFAATPAFATAQAALGAALCDVLAQLEPELLGVYWPLPGEFNPGELPYAQALPFARREPAAMSYRRWDGVAPTAKDECGIGTGSGAVAVPDVVLVPCVGFTRQGFRLGYGGGYFDRFLSAHPGITAVGVAWSGAEARFEVQPHDLPLTLILTEREVIAPD